MRASCLVWCGVMVLGASAPSAVAVACGGLPEPQHGLVEAQPLSGALDVPRDAPLVFAVDCQSENAELNWAICQVNRGLLQVTLSPSSSDEASITGTTEAFGDSQVWVPSAPLLANETYIVDVRLAEDVSPFAGAAQALSFSFTTGDALLPPVSSEGSQQRAEYYEAPVAACETRRWVGDMARIALDPNAICPTGFGMCEAAGSERRARLAVRFDALAGGAAELGYAARMLVTDRVPGNFESLPGGGQDAEWPKAPHDLLLSSATHVAAGSAVELTLDLLRPEREDGDETVCVRALFVDAGGRASGPEPVCKDYDAWLSDASELEDGQSEQASGTDAGTARDDAGSQKTDAAAGQPDGGTAPADPSEPPTTDTDSAPRGARAQAGCAAHGGPAAGLGWLLSLSLWVLGRRRLSAR